MSKLGKYDKEKSKKILVIERWYKNSDGQLFLSRSEIPELGLMMWDDCGNWVPLDE